MRTKQVILNVESVSRELHVLIDTQMEMIIEREYQQLRFVNGRMEAIIKGMKVLAEFMEK